MMNNSKDKDIKNMNYPHVKDDWCFDDADSLFEHHINDSDFVVPYISTINLLNNEKGKDMYKQFAYAFKHKLFKLIEPYKGNDKRV